MPETLDRQQFARWLEVEERNVESYEGLRSVPTEYVRFLGSKYAWLSKNDHDREAFEVIVLILRVVEYIGDPAERTDQSYWACRGMAATCSFLGLWRASIEGYNRAISVGEGGAYALIEASHRGPGGPGSAAQYQPADHRELGSMHGRIGSYGDAVDHHRTAGERLEGVRSRLDAHTYRDELARLRNARALVHMDLGEHEEAERESLAAARIEEELGEENPRRFLQAAIDYMSAGRARRELALRRDEGYEQSFAAFDDASRVLARAPSGRRYTSDRRSEVYLERGRTHLLNGDYETAIADLNGALSLTSDFNLVQHAGEHHLYLGEAHLELGDTVRAGESLEETVALAEGLGTPETLWQARRMLAAVRRAENRPGEARNELRKCIETIEGLRSQTLPESSKISMLGPKDRAYEELVVDLCGSASEGSDAAEVPEITEAFGYVERSKSRVLAERMATRDLAAPAGVPAELMDRERELAGDLTALQDPESRRNAAAGAYDLSAKIEEAERGLREVRDRIRVSGRDGEEYVAMREGAPLDYAGVRGVLGSPEAPGRPGSGKGDASGRVVLVEYFVTEEKVLVFVGRADFEEPRLYEIGISRDALHDWAEVFAGLKPDNYRALWDLEAWQQDMGPLVEPIEECSEEGDVVWIVPHRELHRLPLHALEVGGRYLADRNPVFFTPSASILRYSKAKNPGRPPVTALVLGDSLPEPNDLPSAAEEARSVAALFGTDAYLGDRATKGLLREELRRASGEIDVLHLACHGAFEPDDPLVSRIELAPGDGNGGHPDLTVEDVLGLDLKATLVTLSACESGLSKIHPGEELVGMTRSFLYAGTPALLVSLWSVHDESTGVLMERFYEALLDPSPGGEAGARTSKAQALQAAQRSVRSNGRFDHPFHWASFILLGDWE